jgi:hypothetical protein
MEQFFGDFKKDFQISQEYLTLGFSPSSVPLKQRWRNNGLSADFLADYLTTFFPEDPDNPTSSQRQVEIKGAVSYIANELLENSMKFCNETLSHPISISLELEPDRIIFVSINSVAPKQVAKFQAFIEELLASDPDEFYVLQLERSAEEENIGQSGLGFLTMINDYNAKLGWKFEEISQEPQVVVVTTMVQLEI